MHRVATCEATCLQAVRDRYTDLHLVAHLHCGIVVCVATCAAACLQATCDCYTCLQLVAFGLAEGCAVHPRQ